jgi:hypothetical protein
MEDNNVLTKATLRALRTAERTQIDALNIAYYVGGVRSHVFQEAKYGSQRHATFWIVDREIAAAHLVNVVDLVYPWHHKHIRQHPDLFARAFLKRPIPQVYADRVIEEVLRIFPDADVDLVKSTILLAGLPQSFLSIEW